MPADPHEARPSLTRAASRNKIVNVEYVRKADAPGKFVGKCAGEEAEYSLLHLAKHNKLDGKMKKDVHVKNCYLRIRVTEFLDHGGTSKRSPGLHPCATIWVFTRAGCCVCVRTLLHTDSEGIGFKKPLDNVMVVDAVYDTQTEKFVCSHPKVRAIEN